MVSLQLPSRIKQTEQDPDTLKEPLKVNYGSPNMKLNNIKNCFLILFPLFFFSVVLNWKKGMRSRSDFKLD